MRYVQNLYSTFYNMLCTFRQILEYLLYLLLAKKKKNLLIDEIIENRINSCLL